MNFVEVENNSEKKNDNRSLLNSEFSSNTSKSG